MTYYFILVFIFLIFLILDITIAHLIFKVNEDWPMFILIFIMILLIVNLFQDKYIFIKITQNHLSIKYCNYLNLTKITVIALPISSIKQMKVSKFFFMYFIIIYTNNKIYKFHLKAFHEKKIDSLKEYIAILNYNNDLKK